VNTPVILARLLPGLVGETRRLTHFFPAPPNGAIPEVLTAYCGFTLRPGQAEHLSALTGAPCELCLLRTPLGGIGLPGTPS
jgi:hypothetical protein